MNFKNFAWKYTFCFFLLGQSSYYARSLHENLSNKRMFTRFLQLILYIPAILYLIYVTVVVFYFFDLNINQQLSINFSFYSVFMVIAFFNCVMAMKFCPLFPNNLKKIWNAFESLEYYSSQTLQFKWSYNQCERKILKKFFIIIILFIFRVGIKLIFRGEHSIYEIILTYSVTAITFVSSIHALFYLDTLHFMMKTINERLLNPIKNIGVEAAVFKLQDIYEDKMYADIEVYKNIHHKMWRISKLINDDFGWIFVGFFMQVMINIWNLVTWFIIDIHNEEFIQEYQVMSAYFIDFFFLYVVFSTFLFYSMISD